MRWQQARNPMVERLLARLVAVREERHQGLQKRHGLGSVWGEGLRNLGGEVETVIDLSKKHRPTPEHVTERPRSLARSMHQDSGKLATQPRKEGILHLQERRDQPVGVRSRLGKPIGTHT
jgi:hypothetical protein